MKSGRFHWPRRLRRLVDGCISAVRIEFVVEAEPDNVIRDFGSKRRRQSAACSELLVTGDSVVGAEAHVQVFDLARHVASQMRLDARRPPHSPSLCAGGEIVIGKSPVGFPLASIPAVTPPIAMLAECAMPPTANPRCHRQRGRCERDPRRPRTVPNQSRLWLWSSVTGVSKRKPRVADRSRAQRRCDVALGRELDVGFETGKPNARLQIVAGLDAADAALEPGGGLCRRTGAFPSTHRCKACWCRSCRSHNRRWRRNRIRSRSTPLAIGPL